MLTCDMIFCDDIRSEVTGKLILVGVYSDKMFTPGFPLGINLSVLMRIKGVAEPGPLQFVVTLSIDEHQVHQIEGTVEVQPNDTLANIIVTGAPILLSHPGSVVAKLDVPRLAASFTGSLPVQLRA